MRVHHQEDQAVNPEPLDLEEGRRLETRLTSLDELLTPEQRKQLSDDLDEMARSRRCAEVVSRDLPMA